MLRIELYNNRTEMPKNLSKFSGQSGDTVITPATKWWTNIGHPELGEFQCWRKHPSLAAAKQWRETTYQQYEDLIL